ncbi:hypothetical protein AAZX31_08G203900 [Glycine max]|uniref:Uncharacterized protein n=2 Tax=Glycine subgen. Soja TaxID=1462606 RepID=I1KV86_SOYBN|nr:uncharacterized protein LOC100816014 [Glycine max]XP_028244154.1 uncharacterized protein LOC114422138 [Glycine soja]KAG5000800.1 hypothetical protein JHK87_021872 [Glycine soja]KAG5026049.1 hypothetical protein JHK86_021963 [Glycine max]KAH1052255.1 hypothetical protein GYH30_021877 [Glycine max]KAH1237926.1 hypothetical protein GmHk_08G022716 [Glycine max]KHN47809.1 hypothetical protein glysoja_029227 [Glycine soja]|eukprot:XP_003531682.1 uncharacterized protein LOC100816014 [Glycine max]
MASNDGGGKEERRRRIAERGSDRMALITGRINALPPTPPSSASSPTHRNIPRHAQSMSVAAFDSNSDDQQQHHLPPRHQRPQSLSAFTDYHEDLTGGAENKRSVSLSSARLKHQGGFRYSNMESFDFNPEEEPLIQDSDTITEANNQVSEGNVAKMKPPSVPSNTKNPAHDTQQLKQPLRHNKDTFFSSRELNICILASEPTRALSSLIIALLVVFYYMISERVLASRPLYILLLTDVTIVLARLYGGKASVLEEAEGEKVKATGDGHNWGDAVKLMERGLVTYQAIRGLFIDCSIYLVVVVCGTSLM